MIIALALAAAPAWQLIENVDPITDKTYATLALVGVRGKFALRCDASSEGELYAAVLPDDYIGGNDTPRYAAMRFDGGKPKETFWYGEYKYAYSGEPDDVHFLLNGVSTASKMVIQVYDHGGRPVNMLFDIPQDRADIARITALCTVPKLKRKK